MRSISFSVLLGCLALCLATTGCRSKVRFEEEASIDKTSAGYHKIIERPKSNQKIRVELIGASEPVSIIVFLGKDEANAMADIEKYRESSPHWLAFKNKVKDAVLEVTIPAKEEIHIFVQAQDKSATAKVRVNSY